MIVVKGGAIRVASPKLQVAHFAVCFALQQGPNLSSTALPQDRAERELIGFSLNHYRRVSSAA